MASVEQNTYADIVFSCVEETYLKREVILTHHTLLRVLSGTVTMVQADGSYVFGPGDTVLIPRNQPASVTKAPRDGTLCSTVLLTFTTERLKRFYAHDAFKLTHAHTHTLRAFEKHPLLESFFASLAPYFRLENALPEKLIDLKLAEAVTIMRSLDPDIDHLLVDYSDPGKLDLADYMERNYMFNLPLERFAYLTGRSLSTFKRDFRKVFGTSPQKWLTPKRLELAHYYIIEKRRKPVEVYFESGFENLSHFSYAFKNHFGYPPTEMARLAAQSEH